VFSDGQFVTAANGQNNGQPFPYTFAPLNSSRSHPDPNIDWSAYEPISDIPGFDIHNRTPYTEEWSLSFERQVGPRMVLSASYLGTSSHRLLVLVELNPGNLAFCLRLSPSKVQPGALTCERTERIRCTTRLPEGRRMERAAHWDQTSAAMQSGDSFYGPGADNYDMSAAENLPVAESKALLFRVEPSMSSTTPNQWTELSRRQHRQLDLWECHQRRCSAHSAWCAEAELATMLRIKQSTFAVRHFVGRRSLHIT
jgi:hypothetical protein